MIGRLLISLLLLIPVQFLAADRSSSGATVPVQEAKEEASAQPSHGVLTLDYVVREALAKNPAVESARHTVEAQRAKVPQAGSLPDPTVSVGWAGNIQPSVSRPAIHRVTAV